MKRMLISSAVGVALLGGILLPVAFRAQPGSPRPAAPAATSGTAAASPAPQRHPRIEAAIRHLEEAKHELEAAEGNFHGHRDKAIAHVNQALEECHRAL
jgi:hypothetical protein